MRPCQRGCGYRLTAVPVHLLREELQLVNVFRTPVDQDSCLVIVPEPTLVQAIQRVVMNHGLPPWYTSSGYLPSPSDAYLNALSIWREVLRTLGSSASKTENG